MEQFTGWFIVINFMDLLKKMVDDEDVNFLINILKGDKIGKVDLFTSAYQYSIECGDLLAHTFSGATIIIVTNKSNMKSTILCPDKKKISPVKVKMLRKTVEGVCRKVWTKKQWLSYNVQGDK